MRYIDMPTSDAGIEIVIKTESIRQIIVYRCLLFIFREKEKEKCKYLWDTSPLGSGMWDANWQV